MIYLRLFYEFFLTGLLSFGGGLATIPFLSDMGVRTGWFTAGQLADMIAISESTPGPIGINMATYVGFTTAGIPGSIIATIGLVAPSVIVIILIAKLLARFKESWIVQSTFYGLRPASIGLIAAAGVEVVKISLLSLDLLPTGFIHIFNWKGIILAVILFVLIKKLKGHPIFYLAGSAVVGILFKFAE
jgi:chromate transporter